MYLCPFIYCSFGSHCRPSMPPNVGTRDRASGCELWKRVHCQATFFFISGISVKSFAKIFTDSSISKSSWSPSQNFAEVPKYLLNLNAVSAVILLFRFTISLTLVWGILRSFASLYWLIPIGIRNSSNKTSPGCMFGNFSILFFYLMIVCYLNLVGVISYPFENDSPLVVNSNTPKIP